MFPKQSRIKNKKLMKSYHSDSCVICGNTATPAHTKSRGSGGDDTSENIAPLCGIHHTEQGAIGMTTFSKKYPAFKEWLLANGWELNEFLNKWKHYKGEK